MLKATVLYGMAYAAALLAKHSSLVFCSSVMTQLQLINCGWLFRRSEQLMQTNINTVKFAFL
jgi:hypothetical protein